MGSFHWVTAQLTGCPEGRKGNPQPQSRWKKHQKTSQNKTFRRARPLLWTIPGVFSAQLHGLHLLYSTCIVPSAQTWSWWKEMRKCFIIFGHVCRGSSLNVSPWVQADLISSLCTAVSYWAPETETSSLSLSVHPGSDTASSHAASSHTTAVSIIFISSWLQSTDILS